MLVSIVVIGIGILMIKYGIGFTIGGVGGLLSNLGLKSNNDEEDEE